MSCRPLSLYSRQETKQNIKGDLHMKKLHNGQNLYSAPAPQGDHGLKKR